MSLLSNNFTDIHTPSEEQIQKDKEQVVSYLKTHKITKLNPSAAFGYWGPCVRVGASTVNDKLSTSLDVHFYRTVRE